MILTGAFFVLWDIAFTQMKVWGFNPEYVLGIYFYNLPLEEVLFFVAIPYSCVFIYECINYYLPKDWFAGFHRWMALAFAIGLIYLTVISWGDLYTMVVSILSALFLLQHALYNFRWMGKFFRAYLFCLLPFFIVNGILTAKEIVIYNEGEISGAYIFSIPVEDTIYLFLLLFINIWIYESLQRMVEKRKRAKQRKAAKAAETPETPAEE